MSVYAIVLAAGEGTRMKSPRPKVMHEVAGKPMLLWIVEALEDASFDRVIVVTQPKAEEILDVLPDDVQVAVQEEQLGTAHATEAALGAIDPEPSDQLVVTPGDTPLLRSSTLQALLKKHRSTKAAATILTTELPDPTGYGRVVRDAWDSVTGVVEHVDASSEHRAIREVATAVYAFAAGPLAQALAKVGAHNVQGERYLPDVVGILSADGAPLSSAWAPPEEVAGVNSYEQLAEASRIMRRRINAQWMAEGVWMADPEDVYIDASAVLSTGARIYPGVHIEGESAISAGAEVGPDSHIRDSRVGEEARVRYSVLDGVEVGARAVVGPYAHLRPGTVLGPEAKAGTFVEMKKSTVGARSKVPHLSYMGDATIGEDANVGAGSITCNWDGVAKHPTAIGDRAFIGSDTMLVAPVEVGDDAVTGAGSVITKDVSEGSLGVERSSQREIAGYAERKKRQVEGQDSS